MRVYSGTTGEKDPETNSQAITQAQMWPDKDLNDDSFAQSQREGSLGNVYPAGVACLKEGRRGEGRKQFTSASRLPSGEQGHVVAIPFHMDRSKTSKDVQSVMLG